MKTIKVGLMPGKLQQIEVSENTTAREVFEKAGIELTNHEIRLDGEKIDLDTKIYNGNLCVGLKMIKGNSDVYVSDCTEEEIEMLLEVALPKMIDAKSVNKLNCNLVEINISGVEGESVIVEESMFNSVYTLKSEEQILQTSITETNNNNKIEKTLKYEMIALEARHQCLLQEISEISLKKTFLKDLLNKLGM